MMKRIRTWLLYTALFAGMIYSTLALIDKPVSAAGCDCNQAYLTAQQICSQYGGVAAIKCANGGTYYDFVCNNGFFFRFGCN